MPVTPRGEIICVKMVGVGPIPDSSRVRVQLPFMIFQRVLDSQNIGLGSAGGVYAIILANIIAIFLMRIVGKNLDK